MNEIWVNRLIAGTKTWEDVPVLRKNAIKEILSDSVKNAVITSKRYSEIIGEDYT